jgi:hypothetical protein
MIRVPELGGDEDVLPLDGSALERGLQGLANGGFIAVAFGAIEVSKPDFQCGLNGLPGNLWIGDQGAKTHGGEGAGAMDKGDSRIANGIIGCHVRIRFLRPAVAETADRGNIAHLGPADKMTNV